MKAIQNQINKLNKKVQEINEYVNAYNSPLAPQGELAREEFGLEFNDVVSRTIENLKVIRRKMFEKLEVRDE